MSVSPRDVPQYRDVTGPGAWRAVLHELAATVPAPDPRARPRYRTILMPMLVGASDLFAVREGLLAHALRLRGAEVVFVLCDGMTACDARTYDHDPDGYCAQCLAHGEANLAAFGHRVLRASAHADLERAGACAALARARADEELLQDAPGRPGLAAHVFSSTLRYLRAGVWAPSDARTVAKGREYLETALLMREFAQTTIARVRPDKVVLSHGVYATWGPWADQAVAAGVPFDTCCGGWRRNTLFLQHDDPRALHCDDLWPDVAHHPLDANERACIEAYISTRDDNRADAFQYIQGIEQGLASFCARHAIDLTTTRRIVGVFSNVAFDSARFGGGRAFADMFAWLRACVERARLHPDTLFVVKAHPGEANFVESTPEAWRVGAALASSSALPPNVRFVPPDDRVSPYALYALIDAGLVNTSSVGLEMALHGIPVLTTGAGVHYEKPGIVVVPRDTDDYFAKFDAFARGPVTFTPDRELALRYAYALYFRKSMPFEPIDVKGWAPVGLGIRHLGDLAPGRFPGLDRLCEGILEGTAFAMPGSLRQ